MAIGLIADAMPSTIRMLKILEPIALPSAISTSFFLAATIEVTSSGREVPMETMQESSIRVRSRSAQRSPVRKR